MVKKTSSPTNNPTLTPTKIPTTTPTSTPTTTPTRTSKAPTNNPSKQPSKSPSVTPTNAPTTIPSITPTKYPTEIPSNTPSTIPTRFPTNAPTNFPTINPTNDTPIPTEVTTTPTSNPVASATINTTISLGEITKEPTNVPSLNPTETMLDSNFKDTNKSKITPIVSALIGLGVFSLIVLSLGAVYLILKNKRINSNADHLQKSQIDTHNETNNGKMGEDSVSVLDNQEIEDTINDHAIASEWQKNQFDIKQITSGNIDIKDINTKGDTNEYNNKNSLTHDILPENNGQTKLF